MAGEERLSNMMKVMVIVLVVREEAAAVRAEESCSKIEKARGALVAVMVVVKKTQVEEGEELNI